MAKTRGTGLLMAWMDVDPPTRTHSIAGTMRNTWDACWRYPASSPPLATSPCVAPRNTSRCTNSRTTTCCAARRSSTRCVISRRPERTRFSGGYVGRNYLLNGYRQIFPARTNPIDNTMGPSPFLQMGRIDVAASMEEEFNDWYNTAYIPGYLTVPGCIRARRYLAVEGQPKYLTVYEFENAGVPDTPEWARARTGNPWNARMRPHVRLDEGSPAVFRRIYPA